MSGKMSAIERKRKITQWALFIGLLIAGILFLLPMIWMVIVTFEREANLAAPVPPKFYVENFSFFNLELAMEGGRLLSAYKNSGIIAVFAVIIRSIAAMLGGYALSKGKFAGKNFISILLMGTMMIPFEVRMIPMFEIFMNSGWYDTFIPIILPSIIDAFGIFMAKSYFDQLPDSLRESAYMDGLGELRTFFQIYLPLAGPVSSTIAILAFLASWNDFLWPFIMLSSPENRTIPLYIASYSVENASRLMGTTMAVSFMAIAPVLVVYLFAQRYIIESVASSGMKE